MNGAESGAKSCLLQTLHRIKAATGLAVVLLQKHPPPCLHEVHLGVREEAAAFAAGDAALAPRQPQKAALRPRWDRELIDNRTSKEASKKGNEV